MQEAYVNVNNIPTHILTRGKWIEESFSNNQKEVVICITGNPGLPGFYTKYISKIHENLVDDIPVWVIGNFNSCVDKKTHILAHLYSATSH